LVEAGQCCTEIGPRQYLGCSLFAMLVVAMMTK
jgi:hypothetical protein